MAEDKKLIIAEKAWSINWDKIEEGDYYSGNINPVYAENRSKAKSLFLSDIRDYKLYESGEYIEYITIPLRRCKESDKYEFEGENRTEWKIQEIIKERDRKSKLEVLLNDDSITHCYIRKGPYYRPDHCGYTDMQHRAGIYTKEEAVSCVMSCSELSIIPIDKVKHNDMINAEIEDLNTRLIL